MLAFAEVVYGLDKALVKHWTAWAGPGMGKRMAVRQLPGLLYVVLGMFSKSGRP